MSAESHSLTEAWPMCAGGSSAQRERERRMQDERRKAKWQRVDGEWTASGQRVNK